MEVDNIVKAKSNKHKQQQDIKQNHFSCSLWCLLCFLRILKEEKVHFLDPPCVLVLGTSSRPAKCKMQKKKWETDFQQLEQWNSKLQSSIFLDNYAGKEEQSYIFVSLVSIDSDWDLLYSFRIVTLLTKRKKST